VRKRALALAIFYLISWMPAARAGDAIPLAAWRRPIGLPLENPGVKRNATDIDDGYWQGAPVGGFGSGTFSRTYRGDFARWHMKAGVHKYQVAYANEFAMFQQSEGDVAGTAKVLLTDHPRDGALASWQWDYPVGAGEYAALYPKSWYDYRWKSFPAHVVLEQFSPVLPNNYRESSYPIAVYRWHANNPTKKTVTVSVMLSWANMSGWFRSYAHDFSGSPSQGNFNQYLSSVAGASGRMKGIVFDRERAGPDPNEWDGQFAIAALETPDVEVSYQTTFQATGDGKAVWSHFAKNGRLANDSTSWVSDGEKLAGAIAVRFTLAPGESKTIPMVISWDFPVVQFGEGRKWDRQEGMPGSLRAMVSCMPVRGAMPSMTGRRHG
jgi:non-lysosomal glucosylceramidase